MKLSIVSLLALATLALSAPSVVGRDRTACPGCVTVIEDPVEKRDSEACPGCVTGRDSELETTVVSIPEPACPGCV